MTNEKDDNDSSTPSNYELGPMEINQMVYAKYQSKGLIPPSLAQLAAPKSLVTKTPRELKAYLDRFVIEQENAKKIISRAVAYHYRCLGNPKVKNKKNLLLLGPTGVGKTFILEKLAEEIEVPFVVVDSSTLTAAGFKGTNISDVLAMALAKAGGDIERAQKTLFYFDEIDKKVIQSNDSKADIGTRSVQQELLKVFEGTEYPIEFGPHKSQVLFNTKNSLFACTGVFPGLEEVVMGLMKGDKQIGFGSSSVINYTDQNILTKAPEETLRKGIIKYGFLGEFVGRLPIMAVVSPLNKDSLTRILTSTEDSIVEQYKEELKEFGINLRFTKGALYEIANQASKHITGARALQTVCETVLGDFEYALPGSNTKELVVTKKLVLDHEKELKKMEGYDPTLL